MFLEGSAFVRRLLKETTLRNDPRPTDMSLGFHSLSTRPQSRVGVAEHSRPYSRRKVFQRIGNGPRLSDPLRQGG